MFRQITWCACQRETAGDPYSWRHSSGEADPCVDASAWKRKSQWRSDALGGEQRGNTGVIDFWCLYFMLEIGRYIQPFWSMRAVVLRKNLSKCVISPLMEHGRRAILLIPSCSLPAPGLSPPLFPPSPPSASCSLMSPFHYQPSIYQPLPSHPPALCFFCSVLFFSQVVTLLTHRFRQGPLWLWFCTMVPHQLVSTIWL